MFKELIHNINLFSKYCKTAMLNHNGNKFMNYGFKIIHKNNNNNKNNKIKNKNNLKCLWLDQDKLMLHQIQV